MEKELKHAFYINLNWTREDMRAEELCDSILQPDPLFVTDDQCHSSSINDSFEENSDICTSTPLIIYLTGWIDYILSKSDTHLIGSYVPIIFNKEAPLIDECWSIVPHCDSGMGPRLFEPYLILLICAQSSSSSSSLFMTSWHQSAPFILKMIMWMQQVATVRNTANNCSYR